MNSPVNYDPNPNPNPNPQPVPTPTPTPAPGVIPPGPTYPSDPVKDGAPQAPVTQSPLSGLPLTPQEVSHWAQKGLVADRALTEAREIRSKAEGALTLSDDMSTFLKEGDPDAFRRIAAGYNVPQDQVEGALSTLDQESSGESPERTESGEGWESNEDLQLRAMEAYDQVMGGQEVQGPSTPLEGETALADQLGTGEVGLDNMNPSLQNLLVEAESTRMDQIIMGRLDKDPQIGYHMGTLSEEGKATLIDLVYEKIDHRLSESGREFGDGEWIMSGVVPEMVKVLNMNPTKAGSGTATQVNLGAAPGGFSGEGPQQELDPVSAEDGPAYEEYIQNDIQRNVNQGNQSGIYVGD